MLTHDQSLFILRVNERWVLHLSSSLVGLNDFSTQVNSDRDVLFVSLLVVTFLDDR